MSIVQILSPPSYCAEVSSVGDDLKAVPDWHDTHRIMEQRFLSRVWFRGIGEIYQVPLVSGVSRDEFTKRARNALLKESHRLKALLRNLKRHK